MPFLARTRSIRGLNRKTLPSVLGLGSNESPIDINVDHKIEHIVDIILRFDERKFTDNNSTVLVATKL